MAYLYRRKNSDKWWVKYYVNGRPIRQSTKTSKIKEANHILDRIKVKLSNGQNPVNAYRTKIDELCELYLGDYKLHNRKTLKEAKHYVELLKAHFGGMKAANLTTSQLMEYRQKRKTQGEVEDSTINRELSALRKAYRLGLEHEPPLVDRVPKFTMVSEKGRIRQGFFELEEFEALRGALPDHMKVVASIGFYTGMRLGRILSLRWDQVDWDEGMLRLDPGNETKKVGRVPILPELREVLERWQKVTLEKRPQCRWVCYWGRKCKRITRIYTAWNSACERVGLEGKLFHDFRRSAARNFIRAGIPQSIVMEITGHRTDSVFRRYDIVNDEDKRQAALQLSMFLREKRALKEKQQAHSETGHSLGHS